MSAHQIALALTNYFSPYRGKIFPRGLSFLGHSAFVIILQSKDIIAKHQYSIPELSLIGFYVVAHPSPSREYVAYHSRRLRKNWERPSSLTEKKARQFIRYLNGYSKVDPQTASA